MYTNEKMLESIKKVEANRAANAVMEPVRMTAEEKEQVLATYHPDYIESEFEVLQIGPNKGEKVPKELAAILQANSRINPADIDLSKVDYDVDVLVIGGGGAGTSAAIEADNNGAKVMIVTKLRMGDANTMMAEGGIQAADKPNDSPAIHYVDAMGGGHFKNVPELLYKLVTEGPESIRWLNELGVMFDKEEDGTMVTKLRHGDANTMMAEGGIQAADKPNDSPAQHYLDVMGGGHFTNVPELVYKLVNDAPICIKWLNDFGVMFDKEEDGTMVTTHGGGTSRKRMHAAKDYSGAEIMRVLRDEVVNRGIPVVDFTAAIELIKDDAGKVAGAVLMNMETKEILVAKAKTVIMATGGAGRMHYQGFPTSNHYGATADGLVMAYRAGAPLLYAYTLQYHPTGVAYPSQIFGALVTEKVRSIGAQLINANGEAFMNPLETRDVSAASIIRECKERGNGVPTPDGGFGIWLDTPMIEQLHGEGTIEKRIPAMMRMYLKYDIDMRKQPILIYPTLHYQNGGIKIAANGMSDVENLFVAGEAVGGIHGENRLMGNSLLDIIVFGRNAGIEAAKAAKNTTVGKLTLDHVNAFAAEMKDAGIVTEKVSPMLLPHYTHGNPKYEAK